MQLETLEILVSEQDLPVLARYVQPLMNRHPSPTREVDHLIKDGTPIDSEVDIYLADDYRHWSPESEPYASTDALLQHLRDGWMLDATVEIKSHQCQSRHYVDIYYFTLHHHTQQKPLRMPVLDNPVVRKVVQQHRLKPISIFNELTTNNTD